jgi:hypothetical protein
MLTHQNRPEVEFDQHLGRDPQNRDSELFLSDRLARASRSDRWRLLPSRRN